MKTVLSAVLGVLVASGGAWAKRDAQRSEPIPSGRWPDTASAGQELVQTVKPLRTETLRFVEGPVVEVTRQRLYVQSKGRVVPLEIGGLEQLKAILPGEEVRAAYQVQGTSNVATRVWTH